MYTIVYTFHVPTHTDHADTELITSEYQQKCIIHDAFLAALTISDRLYCLPSKQENGEPMLIQCWADVGDGGPTLNRNWFNLSCRRRRPNINSALVFAG